MDPSAWILNPSTGFRQFTIAVAIAVLTGQSYSSADWPQWRGPQQTGFIESGPLLTELPSEGLKPLWKVGSFDGGTSGGWSSPVIVGDRAFVYSHTKTKNADAELGEAKYPWLSPGKRTMSDEEYAQYEIKRRDENERRAKAFQFDQRLLC